jgi:hypothetical protein
MVSQKTLVFHRTIPDTKDLTLYSSSSMSKTFRPTLMENSWYLSKWMFFLPLRTDKQASRQFMFARLFSTRKRIIQLEDFINLTGISSLSSISVQFIVKVILLLFCSTKPETPITEQSCTTVKVYDM